MTAPDATAEALWKTLDEDGHDAFVLSILADRFDDVGDCAAADCLRWAVGAGKRCRDDGLMMQLTWDGDKALPKALPKVHEWWADSLPMRGRMVGYSFAKLPAALFLAVFSLPYPPRKKNRRDQFLEYLSLSDAWRALVAGWKEAGLTLASPELTPLQ